MNTIPLSDNSTAPRIPDVRSLTPFLWVAGAWGCLGLALSAVFSEQILVSAFWMLGIWALCVLDLVALAKTIAAGIVLMSDQLPEKKSALAIQALFWGTLKVLFLGAIGVVLWNAPAAPTVALLSGVATLVIVPLLGGFWWSQKELTHA